MREKLIKLVEGTICEGPEDGCSVRKMGSCGQIKCLDYCALGKIADHLLANGVIVLPCKVGDTVWVINRHLNAVFENTVIGLHCGHSSDLKNHIKTRWVGERGNESIRKWSFRQIGRYVFLTREEAEAALKEGKG